MPPNRKSRTDEPKLHSNDPFIGWVVMKLRRYKFEFVIFKKKFLIDRDMLESVRLPKTKFQYRSISSADGKFKNTPQLIL